VEQKKEKHSNFKWYCKQHLDQYRTNRRYSRGHDDTVELKMGVKRKHHAFGAKDDINRKVLDVFP